MTSSEFWRALCNGARYLPSNSNVILINDFRLLSTKHTKLDLSVKMPVEVVMILMCLCTVAQVLISVVKKL